MKYKLYRYMLVGTTAVAFIAASLSLAASPAAANGGVFWGSDNPPSFTVDQVQKPEAPSAACVPGKYFLGNDVIAADVCVTNHGTWRSGQYIYYGPGSAYRETGYAVGFGSDSKMYRVLGVPNTIMMGRSNTAVFKTNLGFFNNSLNIVHDFSAKLTRTTDPTSGARVYEFREPPDFTLKQPDGVTLNVGAVGISSNGKWLAAELPEKGIVRVNLETLEIKRISAVSVYYWHGSNPTVNFAVSNNGQFIAAMGINFGSAVVTVTNECGDAIVDNIASFAPLANPCEELDLGTYLSDKINRFSYGAYPVFNDDASQLNFLTTSYTDPAKWITLTAPGYNSSSLLDYLALGDSYSSGEGDTENNPATGQRYYLPYTNIEGTNVVPEEMCHLSSRSYPFLLRDAMAIPAYRMKSIACSGAVGHEDYTETNDGYKGQNDRLSVLKSTGAIVQYKTIALNEFIPGRNQQVEFVKKYKPRAITLTAGGNDVNFGGVAYACAPPNVLTSHTISCDSASTAAGRARLGSDISKQYNNLTELYTELHDASPDTKIYAVGYPQFFSSDRTICAPNVRFNKDERIMARAAVVYLNNVIEAAAKSAGVRYIDIEGSLGEHVLCGNEEPYVTGLARSGKLTTNISELFSHESFHPNAKGHLAIAAAIQGTLEGQTFAENTYCLDLTQTLCPDASVVAPQPVSYFAAAMSGDPTNYTFVDMVKKVIQKGKDGLTFSLSNLEPDSSVSIKIFSNPTDLGTYTVDGRGQLNASIPVPTDIPAGFHTLEVASRTFSGEPITLWQMIEIHGREGDIDENGIPDGEQRCLLVPAAGVDYDGDGLDDACDPEIGPAPAIRVDPEPESSNQVHGGDQPEEEQTAKGILTVNASLNKGGHSSVAPTHWLIHALGNYEQDNDTGTVAQDSGPNVPLSSQPTGVSDQSYFAALAPWPVAHSRLGLYITLMAGVVALTIGLWLLRRKLKNR